MMCRVVQSIVLFEVKVWTESTLRMQKGDGRSSIDRRRLNNVRTFRRWKGETIKLRKWVYERVKNCGEVGNQVKVAEVEWDDRRGALDEKDLPVGGEMGGSHDSFGAQYA